MLNRRRAESGAHLREQTFALAAIVFEDTDLYELVRREIDVDLVQHRGREPVVADARHGVEVMRLRAKRPPFSRC